MQVKKQQAELDMEQQTGSKYGKEYIKAVYCHPAHLTYTQSTLSLFTFMHWGKNWQPTPVFLPGESQGRGSLVGCRLWGHTELDTTEVT